MLVHHVRWWAAIALLLGLVLDVVVQAAGELPKLGVERDLSPGKRTYLWSSVLTYDKHTDELFTDEELTGLARQAWLEMKNDWANVQEGPYRSTKDSMSDWRPAAMAALAIGNKVYLSSSLKGWMGFVYKQAERSKVPFHVVDALNRCQLALQSSEGRDVEGRHRTQGACGEVLASHQSYLDPTAPEDPTGRVSAWGWKNADPEYRQSKPEGEFMKPCGGDGSRANDKGRIEWGCKVFMKEEQVKTIETNQWKNKEPPVKPKSTGRVDACPR